MKTLILIVVAIVATGALLAAAHLGRRWAEQRRPHEPTEYYGSWDGYGVPTGASGEAVSLTARNEGFFVDHTYTAKALAALIAYVRDGQFRAADTIVFWHTGGQVGLFT